MKRKVYLGKWYLVFIGMFVFLFPVFAYYIGMIGGLYVLAGASAKTIVFNYLQCLGFTALPVGIMIILWHRQILELYVFSDDGMRLIRCKKTIKTIGWSEIREVKRVPVRFDARFNFYVANRNEFLVFSTNHLFDDYKKNAKLNFCIWRPNAQMNNAITPYLSRLQEQHQEEVKKFFEKKDQNGLFKT